MTDGEPREPTGTEMHLIASVEPGDTMALYANFLQVTGSPHDFTFHFGWYTVPAFVEPPEGVVNVPIRPLAKVSIPLNLVRATINLLQLQAEAWEANFGEPLPEQPQAGKAPEGQ
jgi:hypothetical protein